VNGACDVLVAGAGVSGLTTGVCLAEQGMRVTIWADRPPLETTSAAAGAIWGPHLVEPGERTARWARHTLAVLRDLATEPAAGVRPVTGTEATRGPAPVPGWLSDLPGSRACGPSELPPGFGSGWRYTAPLVHMPTYLGYLLGRFHRAGGLLKHQTVTSLAGAARDCAARVVVNCTGAGAHDLVPDRAVTPVRGQVVIVANPGLSEFFIGMESAESAEIVYMFPHGGTAVLGGTNVSGDWDTQPRPGVAERILRDCAAVEPRLAGARVLGHRTGLRPVRATVRLEAEPPASSPPGLTVVHNYGHGGAGVTMSWGCARDAAALVGGALRRG
jgi:D-amino-acid oxidase